MMSTSNVKWASTESYRADDARLSQPVLGVKKSALKKPKFDARWSSRDTEQQGLSYGADGRWMSKGNVGSTPRNTILNTPRRPRDEQSKGNQESIPRNIKQSTSKRLRNEQEYSTDSEELPPRKKKIIRRPSKGTKKREILKEGAVVRYDSDDELGLVDHPWEWIYAEMPVKPDEKKKKKKSRAKPRPERIVGAKSGTFSCRVGEAVFMKGLVSGEAWVGIICNFEEDENAEKCVNVMWFTTEKEMEDPAKKLMDYMPNELYITPFGDFNPLTCINGRATIVSPRAFLQKYPDGIIPRDSEDFGKLFVCRRGVNQKKTTYTDEFVWEEVYRGFQDLEDLFEMVEDQTTIKPNRRRRRRAATRENEEVDNNEKQEEANGERRWGRK